MYRGAEVFPRKIAMKIGQLSLDGTAIGHWWYVQGVTITFSSGWTVVCVHVVVAASIHGDGAGDNNSSSCLLRGGRLCTKPDKTQNKRDQQEI